MPRTSGRAQRCPQRRAVTSRGSRRPPGWGTAPHRIPMVYSPSFRPCAAEAGTRRHRLTPGCSCAFTKTRDWSRQMQTVEHLVALEQPQKHRQKHGTQDKTRNNVGEGKRVEGWVKPG